MRNKVRFSIFLIVFFSFSLLRAPANANGAKNQQNPPKYFPVIADKVNQQVELGRKIPVLIKLKEEWEQPTISRMATSTDPARFISKHEIKSLQETVESSFTPDERKNDIQIIHKLANTPWITGKLNRKALEKLKTNPNVAQVVEDLPVSVSLAESSPLINADAAFSAGYSGNWVTVAVLDTGIDTDHPGLQDDLAWEECFLQDGGCPSTGTTTASGPGSAEDGHGHGTHVSGIITSSHATYRGIAPSAGIVAIKVLDNSGSGWSSDVISAIDWVTSNKDTYDIGVINMSLGGGFDYNECDSSYPAYAASADAARSAGVTLFAASGNDALSSYINAPACLSSVVSVGAVYDANVGGRAWTSCTDSTTQADQITCFSNASSVLELLAPGAIIYSSGLGGGIASVSGTSMASPHAAAAAALMLQKDPTLLPADLVAILKNTGTPVHDERTGQEYPRIDALAALNATPDTDADDDGIPDSVDSCPDIANHDQADIDGNGIGDACTVLTTSFLHAPHNEINGISCVDCHRYPFAGWEGYTADPLNIDDTIRNYICLQCHEAENNNPMMGLHSSLVVQGRFSNWTTECTDCHDPHFQAQLQWVTSDASDLFLVTGSIDNIVHQDITSLISYSLTTAKASWSAPDSWDEKTATGRGLILVVSASNPQGTFEVLDADGDTIRVVGSVDPSFIGESFGIIYGQMIKAKVSTGAAGVRDVQFFDPNDGFVDNSGSPEPVGICQVCHLQTNYWTSDGGGAAHSSGKCTDCHGRENGFASP